MTRQRTLKSSAGCGGVALHSGLRTTLKLMPADANAGIRIRRTDLFNGAREITASWRHVVDTHLSTTIANGHGATIGTVEHLFSALACCGIDNAVVEVDGPEIPIMDGSAAPFVSMIERAGVAEQDAPRRAIRVLKPVSVGDDRRSLSIAPAETFSVDFEIEFDDAAIGRQEYRFETARTDLKTDIALARTFARRADVNALLEAGYGRGGSLDNTVVVDDGEILNEGGLRYENEFVRHKILDCIGDLYLAGGPVIGAVTARRSGHELNNLLLRSLFADPDAWTAVEGLPA